MHTFLFLAALQIGEIALSIYECRLLRRYLRWLALYHLSIALWTRQFVFKQRGIWAIGDLLKV